MYQILFSLCIRLHSLLGKHSSSTEVTEKLIKTWCYQSNNISHWQKRKAKNLQYIKKPTHFHKHELMGQHTQNNTETKTTQKRLCIRKILAKLIIIAREQELEFSKIQSLHQMVIGRCTALLPYLPLAVFMTLREAEVEARYTLQHF